VHEATREIAEVAPVFSVLTGELLTATTAADGVMVALPARRNGEEPEDAEGAAGEGAAVVTVGDAGVEAGLAPGGLTGVDAGTTGAGAGGGEPIAAEVDRALVAAESSEGAAPESVGTHLLPPTTGVPLPVWTIIDPPTVDAYSLRLVVSRKLYDRGTLVRSSPSLADLAEPATLRLHPQDFDQLGVAAGDDVRITSTKGNVTVPTVPDPGVPRGIAWVHANKAGGRANVLIDGNTPVTDVRVERP
jgi:formylmethanofuran dehydrogenase subunit D